MVFMEIVEGQEAATPKLWKNPRQYAPMTLFYPIHLLKCV